MTLAPDTPDSIDLDLDAKLDWIATESKRLAKHMDRLAAISRLCSFAYEQAQDLGRTVILNVLYVSREEFDLLEGEEHTVNGDPPSWAKEVILAEGHYLLDTQEHWCEIRLNVHCQEPQQPSSLHLDLTLRCPVCGRRADMCFEHGDEWKKRSPDPGNWVREDKKRADAREVYLDGMETMREDMDGWGR